MESVLLCDHHLLSLVPCHSCTLHAYSFFSLTLSKAVDTSIWMCDFGGRPWGRFRCRLPGNVISLSEAGCTQPSFPSFWVATWIGNLSCRRKRSIYGVTHMSYRARTVAGGDGRYANINAACKSLSSFQQVIGHDSPHTIVNCKE